MKINPNLVVDDEVDISIAMSETLKHCPVCFVRASFLPPISAEEL